MYCLNGFRDKTEVVREQAIKFMHFLIIDKLPLNDFYLTYVCPVLVERVGTLELIEESEEIRLELVKFLQAIILKYSNSEQLKPFLNDCVVILCQTITDKHPAIKELSCKCVTDLAEALPRDFHMQAENLIKPIVSCFGHQRFRVRVEAIRATGEVIMHSSYKGLDEVVGPLAEKLFDQIPLVRRTVAQVAARWLQDYRDRYSFFHKILPLLLTGLNDEVEETRNESTQLWEKVGLQYQKENEKDLKDQIDFLLELPKHYPTELKRPNLGCRVLVQRNVGKLAKALSYELTSWQEDVRVRCSQLLCSLALHAEDGLTQNLQELLPAMYSAARDDDQRVVVNIFRASEIMGFFIPVKTWQQLILPVVEDGAHFGHLVVLGGFIKGAPLEHVTGCLVEITKVISDDSICYTRKKKLQTELVKCCDAISEKISKSDPEVGFHLFKILISVISLRDPENSHLTIELLEPLVSTLQFSGLDCLWGAYVGRLLGHIQNEPKSWLVTTPQRCIFETILLHSNSAFGENLPKIGEILAQSLHPEADPESRLKTFWALSTAFDNKSVIFRKSSDLVTEFFEKLISEIFVPSLVWRPGLTAEALRTMAASCLLCALSPIQGVDLFKSGAVLRQLCDKLAPLLISLMEDASFRSRQLALECVTVLKKHASGLGIWTNDDLVKLYPEILKRLDDPTDKVRVCALKILPEIFINAPEAFHEAHFKAHHELIIDTLLTHFDDDDQEVRDLVFDVLKVIAEINRDLVFSKIERHQPLLCNKDGCDAVLNYLNELKLD
ncbi:HEAT repeat-containing protein 2-like Protein [Tribolium castaneum]|uniref:HEAT repeat-containing protein 2-like Protein n=2 Tax=Tribolium castaneum TaxID=7070 RepID=D6WZ28_TRICA|nr:HEAT repeat-containing protein 2-like Protein [Tribolium castaneum]